MLLNTECVLSCLDICSSKPRVVILTATLANYFLVGRMVERGIGVLNTKRKIILHPSQIVRGFRALLDSFITLFICVPYVSRFSNIHMNMNG